MKPLPTEDIILDVLPRIPAPALTRDVFDHWPPDEDLPCMATIANGLKRLEQRGLVQRTGCRTKPRFTLVRRDTPARPLTDGEVNWIALKKEMESMTPSRRRVK